MTTDQTSDEQDMLAGEYALGLLTGDDLAEAKRRVGADPAFARAVTDWEIRLATLTEELVPQTSGPAVKTALMAELFAEPARKPTWERLWLWQGVGVLGLLALAIAFALGVNAPTSTGGPLYTAEIVAEAGDFRVVAVIDKSTNEVFLTRTAGAAPEGRILQVWGHGEGAPAISVGLWPEGDTIRLPMPQTIAAVEGVLTLGISEEPPGGSVTGSPSGRVFGTVDIPGVTDPL
ncbi:anti-sigma factor [Jannaschia pohangensis]|uniref:Anti-sigma-K factor RskA n=1 Tax=Jannaschia pohangensis TaxID=390807 RepID=A0A1I3R7U3_9RHOB|nr:anti-sigma factor [Jannaschia pohangensis]SFJ41407.1 Anti-sigma-K factor RskA [Jannaschia pohangensis]